MNSGSEQSVRQEQVERTRERILDAATALLADESLDELTVALVAGRARVAVRTVYRYFPTKEAVIDAVAEIVDGRLGPAPFPGSAEELRMFAPRLFAQFLESEEVMRAGRVSRAGRQVMARTRAQRIASAERALGPLLAGLPDEERRRVVAVVYTLHSPNAYFMYRDNFGMTASEAGEAAAWATGCVLDELEQRGKKSKA